MIDSIVPVVITPVLVFNSSLETVEVDVSKEKVLLAVAERI